MDERITLDHGSGGQLSAELIERHILKAFPADALHELRDGAIVPAGTQPLVMSTDKSIMAPAAPMKMEAMKMRVRLRPW